MKYLFILALMAFSLSSFAQGKCDLSANDQAVNEVDEQMNNGHMRGEDHAIAKKLLKEERLALILTCIQADLTDGITKDELLDLKQDIAYQILSKIREYNELIRVAVDNNKIEEAVKLMMERDIEVLSAENQTARIDRLLEQQA